MCPLQNLPLDMFIRNTLIGHNKEKQCSEVINVRTEPKRLVQIFSTGADFLEAYIAKNTIYSGAWYKHYIAFRALVCSRNHF